MGIRSFVYKKSAKMALVSTMLFLTSIVLFILAAMRKNVNYVMGGLMSMAAATEILTTFYQYKIYKVIKEHRQRIS